jgi:heme/copper-type cytochrome/quinol oxidase subunit 1
MTTIDPHAAGAGTSVASGERTGGALASVADWITSSDHKKIGRLFIGSSLLALLGVGVIATLLGIERIDATADLIDAGAIPQLFAAYRVLLTLSVVLPLSIGLAVAVVPLQLGARSLAFPRLALLGFWTWLVGTVIVVISIAANGGPGGGDANMVDLYLAAQVLVVAGLLAASGSVAASVLTTRAPGMNMRRVPLFAWSALVQALGLLLALPVFVATLVSVYVDHRYANVTFGGNTGLDDWIQFGLTQPVTVLYALPVFGILLDTLATATRTRLPMRQIALLGIGLVGTAFIAGVANTEIDLPRNLLDMGFGEALESIIPFALVHLLPVLGAVVVLAVMLRGAAGRPRPLAALVLSFFGAGMIIVGLLGNAVSHVGDAQLHGTVFEEGAWIYVMYGTVLGVMGGVVHWGPKLWGRRIAETKVLPLALLGVLATILASLPYYVAGFADQPARSVVFDYSGPQNLWNILATAGHALMLLTVLAFIGLARSSFRSGEYAGDDPFDGQTLEWATSSPAPANNFAELHIVASAEPLLDLKPSRTEGNA